MKHNYTEEQVLAVQNCGVQFPMEFVLKNYLGLTNKQISEFKQQQLEDARHRYMIANIESGKHVIRSANVIPFIQPELETDNDAI